MADVLVLDDVWKDFGGLEVLKGVQLSIRENERHAIIGPNGAGKSTLFNIVSGLLRPSKGAVRYRGEVITGLSPRAIAHRGIGRSFQIINVFPRLTVFENIRSSVLSRRNLRCNFWSLVDDLADVASETEEVLSRFGLGSRRDVAAGALSHGEQRELELALTAATEPRLLLLDEPCAGLNAQDTDRTVDRIVRMSEGRTLLMVEHDMNVVFRLAQRVTVIHYGRVLATGTPDEIKRNDEVQTAYLGRKTRAA